MARSPQRALFVAGTLALSMTAFGGFALEPIDFRVAGDEASLAKDLRAASGLIAAQSAKRTAAVDLFADARAEYGRLLSALYAKGHYGPVIHVLIDGREASAIAPLDAPASINRIVVTVDPGPAFTFSTAVVKPLEPRTEMPTGFAAGQVAESQIIKDAVQAGVNGWRAQGYAKTSVSGQDLTADHAKSTLRAVIDLDKGPLLRFGHLTITGTQRLRLDRARKIAGLDEGTRFDPAEAQRVATRLRRTGIFSTVSLTEDDKITAPDLLGMTVNLVEAKTRRYTFGAEVASTDGAIVSGSWLHRNLLGGGERLEISGAVSGIGGQNCGADYELGVTLDRPAVPGRDNDLNLGFNTKQTNDANATALTSMVSGGLTHYFSDELIGHAALAFEVTRGKDAASSFDYQTLNLPVGVTWDRRDSKTDPTRLYYLDAEIKPFYGFGSTDNGARLTFDARAYKGLGAENRVVLAGRLQGGAVLGASILGTPRGDLFYSGGGGTVRGQPYQSLGVTVSDGGTPITIGGNQFLATSVEARVKVTESIGLVGFVDMGLVGNQGNGSDWQAGAGLGLRYATPIGPIRLDVALPVSGGSGAQVYIGLGQAF